MKTTLQEVATLVGGVIAAGDGAMALTGFSSIAEAEKGEITFLGNPRYAPALKKSRASAVLVDEQFQDIPASLAVIRGIAVCRIDSQRNSSSTAGPMASGFSRTAAS